MFGVEHLGKDMWVRLFAGEASPFEVRCCSGQFALMPWMVMALVYVGPYCFSRSDSVGCLLFFAGLMVVSYLWLRVWVRFISANVSWVLGSIFWLAMLGWAISAFV